MARRKEIMGRGSPGFAGRMRGLITEEERVVDDGGVGFPTGGRGCLGQESRGLTKAVKVVVVLVIVVVVVVLLSVIGRFCVNMIDCKKRKKHSCLLSHCSTFSCQQCLATSKS